MTTKSYLFNSYAAEMAAAMAVIDAHIDCFVNPIYENFELRIICKDKPDLIASIEKVLSRYV